MTKRELFNALFPSQQATYGNKKYARFTKPQLEHLYEVRFGQPHTHNDFEKGNCIEINLKELNNENK